MKRSRWEIFFDILKVISSKNKCKKTHVLHGAQLDWRMLKKHFGFLMDHDFIKESERESGNCTYEVTEKGEELLDSLETVKTDLESLD